MIKTTIKNNFKQKHVLSELNIHNSMFCIYSGQHVEMSRKLKCARDIRFLIFVCINVNYIYCKYIILLYNYLMVWACLL